MVSDITFNTAIIRNSITGTGDASEIKDNVKPFSFLDFIINTNVEYTPEEYNNFYIFYLKKWADVKNSSDEVLKTNYITLYVEFLKEITLTYSTQQELKFLSNLDFTDPVDLDVAIPFYVEKIRQIILFFKSKRDEGKYVIDRNKIKGTNLSIERSLFEKIYDYLLTAEEDPRYNTLAFSLSNITTNLKIDIGEFVDVYSNYFDVPRSEESARSFLGSNLNDIEVSVFFDDVNEVFKGEVFLTEIPIAINNAVNLDITCSTLNPIFASTVANTTNNVSSEVIRNCSELCGFDYESKLELKQNLIKKYIGTDFYYIDTTVSPPVSGLLFKADKPYGNIQNLQTADTASTPSNQQKLLRDIGIFFKPDKTGIFKLQANKYTYEIDVEKIVSSNKIYIFPDPSIYGNVSTNSQEDYPLIFEFDFRHDLKNVSSSFSNSDPYVRNDEQTFSPYYTRQQSEVKNFVNDNGILLNFSDLYNKGYITKYQTDVFGNEYALFKDELGSNFKSIDTTNASYIKNLLLDGYVFRDQAFSEGYNFNYSTAGIYATVIRSGLSSHTVDIESSPNFVLSGSPYYLYFREFTPYQELNTDTPLGSLYATGFNAFTPAITAIEPGGFSNVNSTGSVYVVIKDCIGFRYDDGSVLPDPLFADYEDYPSQQPYYYNTLVDCGISTITPTIERAYFPNITTEIDIDITTNGDIPVVRETSNADFTLDINDNFIISEGYYDGGYFNDKQVFELDDNFITTIAPGSNTVLSNLRGSDDIRDQIEKRNLLGKIFVKNQTYSSSLPLSTALFNIFNKYSASVESELYTKPRDLEVIYDNIIIETQNYLVFDKILYDDGVFITPETKNTFFDKSNSFIRSFSNRFFNEKDKTVTFCITDTVQSLSGTNNKPIYPNIYQLDITKNNLVKIFPKNTDVVNLSSTFSVDDIYTDNYNINIVNVKSPILTYNSFNDMYKLSYTGVDNNNLFHLFDCEFSIVNGEAKFYSRKYYKHNKTHLTSNFTSPQSMFATINEIEGNYTINSTTGEIIL